MNPKTGVRPHPKPGSDPIELSTFEPGKIVLEQLDMGWTLGSDPTKKWGLTPVWECGLEPGWVVGTHGGRR
jgi:hypothetical protein